MSFFNNLSTLFNSKQGASKGQPAKKTAAPAPVAAPATVGGRPVPAPQPLATKQTHQQQPSTAAPKTSQSLDQFQQVQEAQSKARDIVVEAKAEALAIRSKAEQEQRELISRLEGQQKGLETKLDALDLRLGQMDQKEANIEKERASLTEQKKQLSETHDELAKRLEKVAGITSEEAKKMLFDELQQTVAQEKAQVIRQAIEDAKTTADEEVKQILLDSMMHGATDYVSEYTVSVVTLPNEEAKGKIIGKSGRNINAFERYTGVDVDLDMSPTEVRLSCFDPVRREIARISLERLIKDGRIQPSRIEETVAKVKTEIDRVIFEAGKGLCHDLGVFNLPNDLMKLIGKFKYRFSYGQNLIAHTLEETKIGIKLASELGIDVNTVKLGCLLHDIGKVSEETEGSHVELGIAIAKRFNLPQGVIDAIAQHHEDEPFSGPEQVVVYIADAISGARPGARYENYDEYIKRLKQLEEIAMSHKEVAQAFAIQAGREVRVILEPEHSKDDDVTALSLQIRDEIKSSMTYPGTVTVTVIREMRAQNIAK